MDAVGIFRKSGGKQRINHLKEMIEGDPGITVFHFSNSFLTIKSTGCVFFQPKPILVDLVKAPYRRLF